MRLKQLVMEHLESLLLEPCDRGRFKNYEARDDELYVKAVDFHAQRRVWPNIMIVTPATYAKIEAAVMAEDEPSVVWADDGPRPVEFHGGLSTFTAADFSLEFCLDSESELAEDEFVWFSTKTPILAARMRTVKSCRKNQVPVRGNV